MGLFTRKKKNETADDHEGQTKKLITRLFDKNLDASRQMLERTWFLNILYYMGEQYIEWAVQESTFRRRGKIKTAMPTPVTNIIRDSVRSVKALILNKDYDIRVWPNSNDLDDQKASELGRDLLLDMDSRNDNEFDDEKEKTVLWMLLTGCGFLRTFPELEKGEFGFDKQGEVIPSGDVSCQNLLSFNFCCDQLGTSLNEKRFIGIESLKPREWAEDTFKILLSKGDSENGSINYQKKLMKFVGNVSPWKSSHLNMKAFDETDEDLVLFREVEFKPNPRYPDGRYVVSVGDQMPVDVKHMPIPAKNGKWNYTVTDFHYNYVPGRFWSDAYVTDLISPQNSINSIDQDLEKNRHSVGQPIVIAPEGVKIQRLNSKDMGFIILQYSSYLSGGHTPTINRGTPLPQEVLAERAIHRTGAQDASGDPKNVMRGGTPGSQASGVLVDILRQAAEMGHSPDINRFYRKLKQVYSKRLILAQNLFTEKRMLKITGKGDNKKIKVKFFLGADLRDNTDVRLEISSAVSATQAGQTQMMTEMAKSGVFGDLAQEPEIRNQLMKRVGISGMKDRTNVHIERAGNENARITADEFDGIMLIDMDSPQVEPGTPSEQLILKIMQAVNSGTGEMILSDDPYFKYDDHALHYESHRMFILSDEFTELSQKAQTIVINHTDLHKVFVDFERQQAMQMALMNSGRIPEPSGQPGEQPV